jgi:hypothetical protein
MRSTVWPSDTRAVKYESDTGFVECNIHQNLVECAVQEGRINSHNRVKAAKRHTSSCCCSVLLCDTDIENPIWKALSELIKTDWDQHRAGDTN